MPAVSLPALLTAQRLFMAPVMAAFLIGSLPVLLPVVIYRALTRKATG